MFGAAAHQTGRELVGTNIELKHHDHEVPLDIRRARYAITPPKKFTHIDVPKRKEYKSVYIPSTEKRSKSVVSESLSGE